MLVGFIQNYHCNRFNFRIDSIRVKVKCCGDGDVLVDTTGIMVPSRCFITRNMYHGVIQLCSGSHRNTHTSKAVSPVLLFFLVVVLNCVLHKCLFVGFFFAFLKLHTSCNILAKMLKVNFAVPSNTLSTEVRNMNNKTNCPKNKTKQNNASLSCLKNKQLIHTWTMDMSHNLRVIITDFKNSYLTMLIRCLFVNIVKFSGRKRSFNFYGHCLQCQCFAAVI